MIGFVLRKLLVVFLSKYFEGIRDVTFSKNGSLTIEDVTLRVHAINELMVGVPVRLKSGRIKKLAINIPVANLTTSPIVLDSSGIHVVLRHCTLEESSFYDEKAELKAMRAQKQIEVRDLEKKWEDDENPPEYPKGAAFFDRFVGKFLASIVESIQARLRDVCITFEDPAVCSVVARIQTFDMLSVDQHFEPLFVQAKKSFFQSARTLPKLTRRASQSSVPSTTATRVPQSRGHASSFCVPQCGSNFEDETASIFYKQINLEGLSAEVLMAGKVPAAASSTSPPQRRGSLVIGSRAPKNILLPPCDLGIALSSDVSNRESLDHPRTDVRVTWTKASINVEAEQIDAIGLVADEVGCSDIVYKHRMFRPKNPRVKDNPSAWWRYAINSIIADIREMKPQLRWQTLWDFKRYRERYVYLWTTLAKKNLSSAEENELTELEDVLKPTDIVFFRHLAKREMAIKGLKVKKVQDKRSKASLFSMSEDDYAQVQQDMLVSFNGGRKGVTVATDGDEEAQTILAGPPDVKITMNLLDTRVQYSAFGVEVITVKFQKVEVQVALREEGVVINMLASGNPKSLIVAGTESEVNRFMGMFTSEESNRDDKTLVPLLSVGMEIHNSGDHALSGNVTISPIRISQARSANAAKVGAVNVLSNAPVLATVSFHGIQHKFRVTSKLKFGELLTSACQHWNVHSDHYELQDRHRSVWAPTAFVGSELQMKNEVVYLAERDSIRRMVLSMIKGHGVFIFDRAPPSNHTTSKVITVDSEKCAFGRGPTRRVMPFRDLCGVPYGVFSPSISSRTKTARYLCFSLVGRDKTIDVMCENEEQALSLVMCLQHLATQHNPDTVPTATRSQLIIQRVKMKLDEIAAAEGCSRRQLFMNAIKIAAEKQQKSQRRKFATLWGSSTASSGNKSKRFWGSGASIS